MEEKLGRGRSLMDDVFSQPRREGRLMDMVKVYQTIITTIREENARYPRKACREC
jgi:hypothetical protein